MTQKRIILYLQRLKDAYIEDCLPTKNYILYIEKLTVYIENYAVYVLYTVYCILYKSGSFRAFLGKDRWQELCQCNTHTVILHKLMQY